MKDFNVELPFVENLHVVLQRCFVLILIIELDINSIAFLLFNQIPQRNLELDELNDVSLNDVVFLVFHELEQVLINKSKEDDVQHLVLVHVVRQLLGVVNGDRLGEVLRVHRLLKLLVGVFRCCRCQ